jgi:hypothetical protein
LKNEINIVITPLFRRMAEWLKLDIDEVEIKIRHELQIYVDENLENFKWWRFSNSIYTYLLIYDTFVQITYL